MSLKPKTFETEVVVNAVVNMDQVQVDCGPLWPLQGFVLNYMAARSSFQNPPSFVPSLISIADFPVKYVDGAAVDYFLIEAVNTLRASSAVAAARAKQLDQEMIQAGLIPAPAPALSPLNISKDSPRESVASNLSQLSLPKKSSAEEDDEGIRARLENIGIHVGANLAERYDHRR